MKQIRSLAPAAVLACLIGLGMLGEPSVARAETMTTTVAEGGGLLGAAENSFKPSKPGAKTTPSAIPAPTGNLVQDITNLNKSIVGNISSQLQVIANLFNGDASDAMQAALSVPTIQDGNGYACWSAAKNFTAVYAAHPAALTGQAMTDLEYQRIMFAAANALCSMQACQQVFSEAVAQTAKVAAAAPGGSVIAGQNAFTTACSYISPISIVAPPAGVVATPSPTPTPSSTATAN